jgi:hypothetical protein
MHGLKTGFFVLSFAFVFQSYGLSKYDVQIGYFNYNFISQTKDFELPRSTIHFLLLHYQTADFEVFRPGSRNEFASGFQTRVSGFYGMESPAFSNLNVQDLYYQNDILTIGRKVYRWSLLDSFWQLGAIEPQYRSRSFLPVEQGLTGLFLDIPIVSYGYPIKLHIFATPIFFPDQGPGYLLEDGRFIAQNPWFTLPPTEAYISNTGVTDSLKYNVIIPSINRIIFNSGFGGMLTFGEVEQSGLYVQIGAFTKPNNQLNTAAEAFLQPNNAILVDIFPEAELQKITFADLKYQFENELHLNIGAMLENNASLGQDSSLTRVTMNQRALGHFSLSHPFSKIAGEFKMGVLVPLVKDQLVTTGPQLSELRQILTSQKYPSRVQYQMEAQNKWGRLLYRVSPEEQFELISASLQFPIKNHVYLTLLTELFKAPAQRGFYTKYANLDWLHLGVTYVF